MAAVFFRAICVSRFRFQGVRPPPVRLPVPRVCVCVYMIAECAFSTVAICVLKFRAVRRNFAVNHGRRLRDGEGVGFFFGGGF